MAYFDFDEDKKEPLTKRFDFFLSESMKKELLDYSKKHRIKMSDACRFAIEMMLLSEKLPKKP